MIYKNVARESLTVDSTAGGVPLTATKYTSSGQLIATYVHCQVQAAAIRVTEDTTAPVAGGPGLLFNPGDIFEIWGADEIKAARFIREGSTSATLEVNYYGRG